MKNKFKCPACDKLKPHSCGVWSKYKGGTMLLCAVCHNEQHELNKDRSSYLSFRINGSTRNMIEDACEQTGLSKSEFIRTAILDSIARLKR